MQHSNSDFVEEFRCVLSPLRCEFAPHFGNTKKGCTRLAIVCGKVCQLQRLDFINEQLQKEHHAVQTFDDVDQAMKQYYYVTLPPKPTLSDFYTPSEDQKNREIAFVVGGMTLTGFIVWKLFL